MVDLNEGTFDDSHVFDMHEVRSLVFIIEPRDPEVKINKFKPEELGYLDIKWLNYFGDTGKLTVSPFRYDINSESKFPVEIQQDHDQEMKLRLEVP